MEEHVISRRKGRIPAVILTVGLTLAGCPRRFDPEAAPAITSPDSAAKESFDRAMRQFEAGRLEQADAGFAAFGSAHPTDPLAPLAQLYRGRIALAQGRLEPAREQLSPIAGRPEDDTVGMQARYHLGLALVRLGVFDQGRKLLVPFLAQVTKEHRPVVLAALAHAAQKLGDHLAAAEHYVELYEVTPLATERVWARSSLEGMVGALSLEELRRLYHAAPSGSLSAAVAGQRLAALEAAAGNTAEAERILAATAGARAAVSRPRRDLVGLLVPFSGRYRAAGQELISGAVEASRALQAGASKTVAVAIRDSADAATAARELIEEEKVMALVGALSPTTAQTVAEQAAAAGVPFITLARLQPTPGTQAPFSLLPDNRERAKALASKAHALGVRRVATVAPDGTYGRVMVDAFAARLAELGGTVVSQASYPAGTRSFSDLAERLRGRKQPTFDGLFLPDTAHTLALVAPALARAGLWSGSTPQERPEGKDKKTRPRSFQLLATADGLSDRTLTSAGRYIQGAVLAPGFYPDENAPRSGHLLRRFRQGQGHAPSLVEALGFDGVELVRTLVARGARDRAELATSLTGDKPVQGLTGPIRFRSDGQRVDPPLLYRVKGTQIIELPQSGPGPEGR
jgi:ABC-type branched-subunit amino acid transport system substrate-binding protein